MNMTPFCAVDFCSYLIGATTFKYFVLTGYQSVSADISVVHKIHLCPLLIPLNELPLDRLSLKAKTNHIGTLLPS